MHGAGITHIYRSDRHVESLRFQRSWEQGHLVAFYLALNTPAGWGSAVPGVFTNLWKILLSKARCKIISYIFHFWAWPWRAEPSLQPQNYFSVFQNLFCKTWFSTRSILKQKTWAISVSISSTLPWVSFLKHHADRLANEQTRQNYLGWVDMAQNPRPAEQWTEVEPHMPPAVCLSSLPPLGEQLPTSGKECGVDKERLPHNPVHQSMCPSPASVSPHPFPLNCSWGKVFFFNTDCQCRITK